MGNFNYIECESNDDRNKTISIKDYLTWKPYLNNIIINLKKSDKWKTQLAIAINFISSKDTDGERGMQSKSNSIDIVIYDKADEVIQELFESLLYRYQTGLEKLMKGSDFIFDCVNFLHYKCHEIILKRGGSYIDSADRTEQKKQQQILSIMMINAFNTLHSRIESLRNWEKFS